MVISGNQWAAHRDEYRVAYVVHDVCPNRWVHLLYYALEVVARASRPGNLLVVVQPRRQLERQVLPVDELVRRGTFLAE